MKKILSLLIIMLFNLNIFALELDVSYPFNVYAYREQSFFLNFASFKQASSKGQIYLRNLKNLRIGETQKDLFFIGNKRDGYGIPTPITSVLPLDIVLIDFFKQAFTSAGYEVMDKPGNYPVVDIEMRRFVMDGYLVFGVVGDFDVKLYNKSGNNLLYKHNLYSATVTFLASSMIRNAFERILNRIMKDSYIEFSSKEFRGAFLGKNMIVDKKTADYSTDILSDDNKKELEAIPKIKDTNLEVLNFNKNDIKKIDGLGRLTKLRKLLLGYNSVKKIENIGNLVNLEYLDLDKNDIKNLENLDKNVSLKNLLLSNNGIKKIENLDNNTKIEELNLNFNSLKSITNLGKLLELKYLLLGTNSIKKIENLEKNSKLKWLYLEYNKISKIENLDNLINLEWLNLNGNPVKKIENLDKQTKLRYLNLADCMKISSIENMDKLVNLEVLNLTNTKIKVLENLNSQKKLKKMILVGTKIQELGGVKNLVNLEVLNIRSTNVKSLSDIGKLKKLKILNIAETKIKRLENLENLNNLESVVFGTSQIRQLSEATYKFLKKKKFKFENMKIDDWMKKRFVKVK